MAATIVKTTFQLKRGSAARWEELNLILAAGEPGFEVDTNRLKIGNGETPWNELPYIGGGGGEGGNITIDMALSDSSLNPVANKVITKTIKELEGKINNYQFGEGFILAKEEGVQTIALDFDAIESLIDVSNFVTREEFETIFNEIPTKLSELENDVGYLTEHQDLSAYATKVEVTTLSEYIDQQINETKTIIETQYATKEEIITKEELTEEVENIISEGVKVNSISYGTF